MFKGIHIFINIMPLNVFPIYEFLILRYCLAMAMAAPLDWQESQIKSPSVPYLEQALRVNLGGLLVHWGPFGSGKSFALKDLTIYLQRNGCLVKYLNAQDFDRNVHKSSFAHFLKSELRQPLDKSLGDISRLVPDVGQPGVIKPTFIVDHIEDVMMIPDTQHVLTGIARDCREADSFRFLVCCNSLDYATSMLKWNGGHKIRLACYPDNGRWKEDILRLYIMTFQSIIGLSREEVDAILSCAILCGSPGKSSFEVFNTQMISPVELCYFEFCQVKFKNLCMGLLLIVAICPIVLQLLGPRE